LNPEYADGIYNKGDILVCLNRIPEAIEVMSIAISKRPGWPLYYCNRGKQYIAIGKQKEVLDILTRLLMISIWHMLILKI
jgi:hypothetical protein